MLDGGRMTVEVGNPTQPLERKIENANRIPDDRLDLAREKAPGTTPPRSAEPAVEADFGELVELQVQFALVRFGVTLRRNRTFGHSSTS